MNSALVAGKAREGFYPRDSGGTPAPCLFSPSETDVGLLNSRTKDNKCVLF